MSDSDFDSLLLAARTGDRRHVQTFLMKARRLVCRWGLLWTGSPDATEDIAQKVLIKVHRSLDTYRPGNGRGWLYRIAKNAFLDWERRQGTDRRFREGLALQHLADRVVEEDGIEPPTAALLRRLIDELSPRQRAVLELVDLQGVPAAEAAELLDLAPQTVRVHLARARRALRSRGAELNGGDGAAARPPADESPEPPEVAHG